MIFLHSDDKVNFQDFFSFAATSSLAYSSPSTTGGAPKTQHLNTNSLVHCMIKVVSKDSLREAQLKMVFSLLTTLTLSSECRNIMFKVFWWFSPVSYTNKTKCHDIIEILLKVVLYTINQTKPTFVYT
jgi:hypothetical protein